MQHIQMERFNKIITKTNISQKAIAKMEET